MPGWPCNFLNALTSGQFPSQVALLKYTVWVYCVVKSTAKQDALWPYRWFVILRSEPRPLVKTEVIGMCTQPACQC